jgi:C-terminal processing protease CtpA/Prc
MTLTEKQRSDLLTKIDGLVSMKFYDPNFKGHDWKAIVEIHRSDIIAAKDNQDFEAEVNKMLRKLGSSGLGLISSSTKITPKNAISATLRITETEHGRRWVFQDVHSGGPAAAAGIKSGDVLLRVGDHEVIDSDKPLFPMAQTHRVTIGTITGTTTVSLVTPGAKHKENPCAVPDPIKIQTVGAVPVVKVPLFPGQLGMDFARDVSRVFDYQVNGAKSLVLDLRGNPGGGLGGLRLMSHLVPDKRPVGYSVDRAKAETGYDKEALPRFDRIPKSKLEVPLLALRFARKKSVVLVTEGLGAKAFHDRLVVLINEHTTCASEMVAQFAREQAGARIVGMATPGRLVSHTGFKLGYGLTLALPVAAYVSWGGTRLDGSGISPDQQVDWSFASTRAGIDNQMNAALDYATY